MSKVISFVFLIVIELIFARAFGKIKMESFATVSHLHKKNPNESKKNFKYLVFSPSGDLFITSLIFNVFGNNESNDKK